MLGGCEGASLAEVCIDKLRAGVRSFPTDRHLRSFTKICYQKGGGLLKRRPLPCRLSLRQHVRP